MQRYALEVTSLADPRGSGIARHARQFAQALARIADEPGQDFELVLLCRASRWRRRAALPKLPRSRLQVWQEKLWPLRKPYDVVHALGYRLPHWNGPARVTTIYDIYAALGINFENPADREREIQTYRDLGARSDHLTFISEHSRQDFLRVIGHDERHTSVIHCGVGEEFHPRPATEIDEMRQRLGLREPFLLFVGQMNPNKNLTGLLEGFARSAARDDLELVITGHIPDAQRARLQALLEERQVGSRVRVLGYVEEADVPRLYCAASAVLLPSLYEGFGLPIVEAMASGTPALTSTAASCPEVANGHAVLVDPRSVGDIARGIDQVLRMTAEQREAALAYARTMTWHRMAQKTLEVYRQVTRA
jgi:glycosyltransferase involved in cell wall biosynthesis